MLWFFVEKNFIILFFIIGIFLSILLLFYYYFNFSFKLLILNKLIEDSINYFSIFFLLIYYLTNLFSKFQVKKRCFQLRLWLKNLEIYFIYFFLWWCYIRVNYFDFNLDLLIFVSIYRKVDFRCLIYLLLKQKVNVLFNFKWFLLDIFTSFWNYITKFFYIS